MWRQRACSISPVFVTLVALVAQARGDCPIKACAPEGDAPRAWNDAAVKAMQVDSERAACLASKAAAKAVASGETSLAAAAQFNLGWTYELRYCPREAWLAYRASLCLRPATPTGPAAIVADRCHALGTCDHPCDKDGDRFEPRTSLFVHTGDIVDGALPAALCTGGCGDTDGTRLKVKGATLDVFVVSGLVYEVVVARQLPDEQARVLFRRALDGIVPAPGNTVDLETSGARITVTVTGRDRGGTRDEGRMSLVATPDRVTVAP